MVKNLVKADCDTLENEDPDLMVGEEVEAEHDLKVDEFEMEDEDNG